MYLPDASTRTVCARVQTAQMHAPTSLARGVRYQKISLTPPTARPPSCGAKKGTVVKPGSSPPGAASHGGAGPSKPSNAVVDLTVD